MAPRLCRYECGTMLEGFDEEARKYLESGSGGLHTKERCQEAKAKLAQKNDHGNEELEGTISNLKIIKEIEEKRQQAIANEAFKPLHPEGDELAKPPYVDHTAKGVSKVRIFQGEYLAVIEEEYNKFLADNQGKIKTQGAHDHVTRDEEALVYTIYLYYEEIKQ